MSDDRSCDDWQWNADTNRDCELYLNEGTAAIPASTATAEAEILISRENTLENDDVNVINLSSIEKPSRREVSQTVPREAVEEEVSDSDYVVIISDNSGQKDEAPHLQRDGYAKNRRRKEGLEYGNSLRSSSGLNLLPDVIPATQLSSYSSQTGTPKMDQSPNQSPVKAPEELFDTVPCNNSSFFYDDYAPEEVLQIKSTYDEHYSGEGNSGYSTNFNESLMEDGVSVKEGLYLDEGMDSFDNGMRASGSWSSITTLPKLFRGNNVFLDIPESVRNAYAALGIQSPYDWQVWQTILLSEQHIPIVAFGQTLLDFYSFRFFSSSHFFFLMLCDE